MMYLIALGLLLLSFFKDKKKTKMALKKAWKSFMNILPKFLGVIGLVGIMLAVFDEEVISTLIGAESGFVGTILASVIGAITLIPGFVAFPTAKVLLDNGAGYMQIGVFVSTLMMVGIMTMPVEIEYFGKKVTLIRNGLAFLLSFVVAFFIGKVAGGVWF
ncbi:permease [Acidaminobacter sp. JC074]|uniref:permease n=1 Tax=Acidaminobacter sp. JC074 TaxID=2530199 RepID=UPI001F0FF07D|nr:permease [Acidaminobacter sp. JC074]MCH4888143.1 permease [Acidaminobacter sp. JC074]